VHARRVWWISPNFETHPVLSIGDALYRIDPEVVPPFLEPR
jgi:hypothetical protein